MRTKVEGDTIPVLDFASAIHKQVPDTFMWNSVARKITYIPLASSHLMDGHPVIEYLDDDMCIIMEGKSQWINCVDYKGNFLSTFRHVGNGPGEYVNLSSVVYHSKDSTIRIFDNGSYKHIIYNKQGKFLRRQFGLIPEFNTYCTCRAILISFISTSEAAPTYRTATPPDNLARRSCNFSRS